MIVDAMPVDGLMSEFDVWFSRFGGVSTRRRRGCLGRFLFRKVLSHAKEHLGRPGAGLSAVPREESVILCREVLREAMPAGLYQAYGEWHYGIFAGDAHK